MNYIGGLLLTMTLTIAACATSRGPTTAGADADRQQPTTEGKSPDGTHTAKPAVIAHRGLHHKLPENSKEAMLAAWKAGVQWCECDVYLSADGVAFLMHDAKLARTTEAKGGLAGKTWAELRKIRLRNPDKTLSKCRIPSLEEVLAVMPAGCWMLIEVKPANNEKLVSEVLRVSKGKRVAVQSFDAANVRHAMRLGKGVPTAFLFDKPEQLDDALAAEWTTLNIGSKLFDKAVAERVRKARKSLGVWTLNEPADIRNALDIGVDRIITDQPERVKEALR